MTKINNKSILFVFVVVLMIIILESAIGNYKTIEFQKKEFILVINKKWGINIPINTKADEVFFTNGISYKGKAYAVYKKVNQEKIIEYMKNIPQVKLDEHENFIQFISDKKNTGKYLPDTEKENLSYHLSNSSKTENLYIIYFIKEKTLYILNMTT